MNVHPDHFEVYANGVKICDHALGRPVGTSKNPLCIGNLGYMHYYVGAISEVALTNSTIDSATVTARWQKIRAASGTP